MTLENKQQILYINVKSKKFQKNDVFFFKMLFLKEPHFERKKFLSVFNGRNPLCCIVSTYGLKGEGGGGGEGWGFATTMPAEQIALYRPFSPSVIR
jgi:hypothetical protein